MNKISDELSFYMKYDDPKSKDHLHVLHESYYIFYKIYIFY